MGIPHFLMVPSLFLEGTLVHALDALRDEIIMHYTAMIYAETAKDDNDRCSASVQRFAMECQIVRTLTKSNGRWIILFSI